jgi:hypothetical protein
LVRNPSGHPQNINDGVLIYSTLSDAVVLEVASIFGSNSVNQFTFTGGGRYAFGSTDGDYITYTAVAATGGSGNGAKFDVVRSKTDLGSVISVTVNSAGENYAAANTLTIPKESIGYSVSNTDATDITVTISSTAGTQSGIKTVTVVSNPSRTSTTFSNVISACTSSAGKNATFTLTWDGSSVMSAPTINNSGAGYKVGDKFYYYPDKPAVREDIAIAVAMYNGYDTASANAGGLEKLFSDYKKISEVAKPYIALVVENKIMMGDKEGTFRPQEIRWQQVLKVFKAFRASLDERIYATSRRRCR